MLGGSVARLRPRRSGEERTVTLHPELGILVRFTVPFPVQELEIDAAAALARATLVRAPVLAARYGLAAGIISSEEMATAGLRIQLVEAAVVLWKEWNVALEGDAIARIDAESVSQILTDPVCHRLWAEAYFTACSLERDEGNVSAVSPSTSSGEAATSAGGAPSSTSPAAADSPAASTVSSAPSTSTRRRRRKVSSSAASDQLPGSSTARG